MNDTASSKPTFHALLIGIDHYRPNRLPDDTTYASLGGCVADVIRVEAMLRARVVGSTLLVRKLLAPAGGNPAPESDLPTSVNIVNALGSLVVKAAPGDQVYVHYSGHGGRVDTVFKDLKGPEGKDETLVPMDLGTGNGIDPSRYLRDVHLAYLLDGLARKVDPVTGIGVAVTLVFDSCHSGGATRGTDIAFRGPSRVPEGAPAGEPLEAPLGEAPDWSKLGTPEQLAAVWNDGKKEVATRGKVGADVRWLPPPKGYVLLAACRETELAAEASIDGRPRGGVMTDALLTALNSLGAEQSWQTLYNQVLASVHSAFPQVPQLLGEVNRQALGVKLLAERKEISVQSIDAGKRAVTLNAGLASMIQQGSEIAIYALGTTDFSTSGAQVTAGKVTQVGAGDCVVEVGAEVDFGAIKPGAPAILLSVPMRRGVQLVKRANAPHPGEGPALAAVSAALADKGQGFLQESAAGEAPHYLVGVDAKGSYEIHCALDRPIPYLDPPFAAAVTSAATLVDRLLRLNRFDSLAELQALPSRLAEAVKLAILLAPPGFKQGDPVEGVGTPAHQINGTYVVAHGAFLLVRVINDGDADANVAVADLQCDWGISMLVPAPQLKTAFAVVPARSTRTFPIVAFIPPAFGETQDVFKLFAALGPIDFRWLEQPPMGEPYTRGVTRSGTAQNALQRLFASFDAAARPGAATRHAAPVTAPDAQWMTTQVRVLVTKTPA